MAMIRIVKALFQMKMRRRGSQGLLHSVMFFALTNATLEILTLA